MNESAFYKLLKKECLDLRLFRIETVARDGFPDIAYINKYTNFQGLLELKAVARMPTSISATGLSVEQNLFHYSWSEDGGISYVLCWVELSQVAILWEGKEIFPAWRKKVIGNHTIIPRNALNTLSHHIR